MLNPKITKKEINSWTRFDLETDTGRQSAIVPAVTAYFRSIADIFHRFLSGLVYFHPQAGFALAGHLGRMASLSSLFGPAPKEVAAFLQGRSQKECRTIAREISASALKNLALRSLAENAGLDRVSRLIRPQGIEDLRCVLAQSRPVVFVFGHNCPLLGILAGLSQIDHPLLVIRAKRPFQYRIPGHITSCFTRGTVRGRILALKAAVDQLKSGGAVMMALWTSRRTGTDQEILMGRRMPLRRGFAAAARITGAAVVPVFSSWEQNGRIDLNVFPPFSTPDPCRVSKEAFEHGLMDQARLWLEERIRSAPAQIQIDQLRLFLKRPLLTEASHAA